MRLLITGATGFVGRNLLLRALKMPEYTQIILPVRSLEKLRTQFLGDGFDEIPPSVQPIVCSGPEWKFGSEIAADHLIHSAGLVFGRTRRDYFRTNVDGTLELFRKLVSLPERAVILSSMAASGPNFTDRAKTESDENKPLTWYGESKLAMEDALQREFSDLNYLCLRPPFIFGPRDEATLPLFKMVRSPFHFKPGFKPKVYSFISVGDLVDAIFKSLKSTLDWTHLKYRNLFIAADKTTTDEEILAVSAELSKKWGMLVKVPQPLLKLVSKAVEAVPRWRTSIPTLSADRAQEIWPDCWWISSQKFSEQFSWQAREDLKSALGQTYQWYLTTGQLSK